MRITFFYKCGHIKTKDVDARMAANRLTVRAARHGDGKVIAGTVCKACNDRTVREWIASANREELAELAQHVQSVKVARDWILSRTGKNAIRSR